MYAPLQKRGDQEERREAGKENHTGIPDVLKNRFEAYSGYSLEDVKIHYNSAKPEQLQAKAYTQGNHVYIGTGGEASLPHELGHVIQQKRGGIIPTGEAGGRPLNDSPGLEEEAGRIAKAACGYSQAPIRMENLSPGASAVPVVQRDELSDRKLRISVSAQEHAKKRLAAIKNFLDAQAQVPVQVQVPDSDVSRIKLTGEELKNIAYHFYEDEGMQEQIIQTVSAFNILLQKYSGLGVAPVTAALFRLAPRKPQQSTEASSVSQPVADPEPDILTRESYREKIKETGFWGSLGEIRAFARLRRRNVKLFQRYPQDAPIVTLVGEFGNASAAEADKGLLHSVNHYSVIKVTNADKPGEFNIAEEKETVSDGNCLYHSFLFLLRKGYKKTGRLRKAIQCLRKRIADNISDDELDYNINELVNYEATPPAEDKSGIQIGYKDLPSLYASLKNIRGRGLGYAPSKRAPMQSLLEISKSLLTQLRDKGSGKGQLKLYRNMPLDEAAGILSVFNNGRNKALEAYLAGDLEGDIEGQGNKWRKDIMPVKNHLATDREQALGYLSGATGNDRVEDKVMLEFTLKPGAHEIMFSREFLALSDTMKRHLKKEEQKDLSSRKGEAPVLKGKKGGSDTGESFIDGYGKASENEGTAAGKIGIKKEAENKKRQTLSGFSLSLGNSEENKLLFQLFVESVKVVDTNFSSVITVKADSL